MNVFFLFFKGSIVPLVAMLSAPISSPMSHTVRKKMKKKYILILDLFYTPHTTYYMYVYIFLDWSEAYNDVYDHSHDHRLVLCSIVILCHCITLH